MYKDILVDNDAAINFTNPINNHYKKFYKWLFIEGSLAVCNKLIQQYNSTLRNVNSDTNIVIIIQKLERDKRLNKISNSCLKKLRIKKHILKKLKAKNDLHILKTVLLSDRKYAITEDINLIHDINYYPLFEGCRAMAFKCPSELEYEK